MVDVAASLHDDHPAAHLHRGLADPPGAPAAPAQHPAPARRLPPRHDLPRRARRRGGRARSPRSPRSVATGATSSTPCAATPTSSGKACPRTTSSASPPGCRDAGTPTATGWRLRWPPTSTGCERPGALELAPAGSVDPTTYDLVVNCSGPAPVQTPGWNPLVDRLLARGMLTAHPLGLGLDLDDAGRPRDGAACRARGPPRAGRGTQGPRVGGHRDPRPPGPGGGAHRAPDVPAAGPAARAGRPGLTTGVADQSVNTGPDRRDEASRSAYRRGYGDASRLGDLPHRGRGHRRPAGRRAFGRSARPGDGVGRGDSRGSTGTGRRRGAALPVLAGRAEGDAASAPR